MRIAIIGGGIGGLSASLALRQFGFEPEVFEQAPELLEVGAAIAVWPNAMRLLQRLGIGETVIQHAGIIEQVKWLTQDGRSLNQVRFQKTNAPAVALHRAKLQNALVRALPANSIHLGRVFLGWQQEGDVVSARFADGSSVKCDLLIGADGLHSRVRAQLLADGPPSPRGYTAWRGIADRAPAATSHGTAVEIFGRGKRFGIGPVGQGRIGWWATVNDPDLPVNKETRRRTAADAPGAEMSQPLQRELLRLFESWCEPVLELIQATPATSIVKNEVFDRRPTRKWGVGPIILLGDAVHPTTPNLGQGGCLAIEDAVVLARCLNKCNESNSTSSPANINRALRTYEELRWARTSAIANYSRRYGAIGQWESVMAARLRNNLLSLLPHKLTQRLLQMIFSYDAYGTSV
ncbi:MAG: FAD-dependent monooxygenase [Acidobacteriota bacterium]|nr:FAD-dependent monooxygenase [Acidobacteriota bacterium]